MRLWAEFSWDSITNAILSFGFARRKIFPAQRSKFSHWMRHLTPWVYAHGEHAVHFKITPILYHSSIECRFMSLVDSQLKMNSTAWMQNVTILNY